MSGCLIGFKTKSDAIVYMVEGGRNATAGKWSVLQQHHGFRLAPPDVGFLENGTVVVVNRKL